MALIAADRPRLGPHRNRFQSHAREDAQIGDEHALIGAPRRRLVDIEGIGVLHQEFAPAHDAEARPLLVAELPLDMVEVLRQVAIGADRGTEDLRDHVLIGRAVEQFALVPVLDAQHFRTIGIVTPRLAPEIGELQRRHQQFDRPRPVHLLADDLRDLLQHAEAERQPGVDARGFLPDHAGAQHQPVRDDLGLFGIFAENRQEITGKTHKGGTCELEKLMRRNSLRRRRKQSQRPSKRQLCRARAGGRVAARNESGSRPDVPALCVKRRKSWKDLAIISAR